MKSKVVFIVLVLSPTTVNFHNYELCYKSGYKVSQSIVTSRKLNFHKNFKLMCLNTQPRDCKLYLKWLSVQRWQRQIYNVKLKRFVWSTMNPCFCLFKLLFFPLWVLWKTHLSEKRRWSSIFLSDQGFKGIVINLTLLALKVGSPEITLTVPLDCFFH